ncbi:MAG: MBOAT family protein [Armatimonas sp.]
MLFSTPIFLFYYLAVFFVFYFLVGKNYRNLLLTAFSLFFYAWGEPTFIGIVLLSSLLDYFLGKGIEKRVDQSGLRRTLVLVGVLNNIGILFYFKYAGFFLASLHLGSLAAIALPIGISFITFEKITYLVDLYRGTGKAAPTFLRYLLYVFFFPKLLAGPIVKYHDIEPQLESHTITQSDLVAGVTRFCIGLAKKVLIADTLGVIVDAIFHINPPEVSAPFAWQGTVFFTLQIFFDFSGYSDMAIGMARMLGFRLQENFNSPYISANITEFWRRWHISLSSWIREYLYIPLGGNRGSVARTYFNLWLCFLASGLWHGARWTFVLWGIYHGLGLVIDRLFWLRVSERLPRWLTVPLCFSAVMLGWILFRAEHFSQALQLVAALGRPQSYPGPFVFVPPGAYLAAGVGLLLSFAPLAPTYRKAGEWLETQPWGQTLRLGFALLVFVLALGKVANTTFAPFLYFRF